MADINRMILLGRLGADPILRTTKNGTPVTTFSLATEVWLKGKNETETTWHRIVTWGKPAKKCNDELKKGMSVFLEGRMRVRKWETTEGQVNYMHEIHVENMKFLHERTKDRSQSALDLTELEMEETNEDVMEQVTH